MSSNYRKIRIIGVRITESLLYFSTRVIFLSHLSHLSLPDLIMLRVESTLIEQEIDVALRGSSSSCEKNVVLTQEILKQRWITSMI